MLNFIDTKLRSLICIGENVENSHIVALIQSKLPQEVNLKLEENRNGGLWTVKNIKSAILKLIVARERTEEIKIKCIYCSKCALV